MIAHDLFAIVVDTIELCNNNLECIYCLHFAQNLWPTYFPNSQPDSELDSELILPKNPR